MTVQPTRVSFQADGVNIVGHLRVPSQASEHRLAALVIAGPIPQVKEQVASTYADRLANAGYITLAFDPRNYGESGGEPRQREDPHGKLIDLRAAVSFLAAEPTVDPERIGAVGICAGAGYALKFAAFDPRVKVFVGIAGFYPSPYAMRTIMGTQAYHKALLDLMLVAQRQDQGGPIASIPHVAPEGGFAMVQGGEAYEYYGSPRGQSPNYRSELTIDTGFAQLTMDNAIGADFLSPTPALMVHGHYDTATTPQQAQAIFDRLGEPKHLVWLPANHIDLYDNDTAITPAITETVKFLEQYL
jgi:uncharacterized protein